MVSSSRDAPNGTATSRDVVAVLRRRALLITAVTLTCTVIAAVAAWRSTALYRATALVRLADARGSITQRIDVTPQQVADRTNPLLSQAQLIRARSLVGRIVDTLNLRVPPVRGLPDRLIGIKVNPLASEEDSVVLGFTPDDVTVRGAVPPIRVGYGDTLRTPGVQLLVKERPNVNRAIITVSSREKTIDWVLLNLRVAPREETDVVEVSYTDADPDRAQQFVNALIRDYQASNADAARARARRRREFLEEQLRVINPQLAAAEGELADFHSQHETFDFGNRLQAEQGALLSLDVQRHQVEADRTTYQALLSALESKQNARTDNVRSTLATLDIGSNPVVVQLYEQLARYQAGRDSLTTGQWRSASTNPDVSRLDTLVAVTEHRLTDAVRGHISLLDARISALGALRDRSAAAIQQLPGAQSSEERLSRQVSARRLLVDQLGSEYQKARMAEAVEVGEVEIVDFASRPYRAEPGLRLLKLLGGLLAGLLIGIGLAFVRERTNLRIRRRGELEGDLRVPVLSIIPRMYSPEVAEPVSRLPAVLRRKSNDGDTRDSVAGPRSLADAEAYRVLRTNLHWSVERAANSPKTLVVTSAMTREGKSMVSANLALAYALEGCRTLLVDCDLRRAKLHRVFSVPRSPGLAHILAGQITPAAAIRSTGFRGLHFLPAGRIRSLPSDLLGVRQTRKVLDELSQNFDIVIIDTPPVLSVADAAILAAEAGGVLLVVRAGETDREAVNQTLRQLDSVGAHILGAVLNDPSGEVRRYGDYYATTDYDAVGD